MDSSATGHPEPAPGPAAPRAAVRLRRRHSALLIAVAALLVLTVGIGGYFWLGSARVLQDYGNGSGGQVQPGETWHFDAGVYPASNSALTIDITDIRLRTTENTADASIRLVTCQARAGSTRIGAVSGDLPDYCASATAWHAGTVTIGPDSDTYFVIAITPRHTGSVEIDGVDVSFREGIRHGTQHTGISIEVTAP